MTRRSYGVRHHDRVRQILQKRTPQSLHRKGRKKIKPEILSIPRRREVLTRLLEHLGHFFWRKRQSTLQV